MESYVLDNLIKYHCFECHSEFILSEYQVENSTKKIICPYCHGQDMEAYVLLDEDDDLLYELGCMGIGHHEDTEEAAIAYEQTWGRIKAIRKKQESNIKATYIFNFYKIKKLRRKLKKLEI